MRRVAALCLVLPWIFAGCNADEPPTVTTNAEALSVKVTSVVTGKPTLTEGQNSLTIHWPRSMRQTVLRSTRARGASTRCCAG